MKTNSSITFGQTFVQSSIKNISKINQTKIEHSYGLGQLYPMDISLGGTILGNLTVGLKRSNILWDHLVINNSMPITNKNVITYYIAKRLDFIRELLYGNKYPIEHHTIKNLDNKSARDIAYEIDNKIVAYTEKYGKMFLN